MNTKYQQLAQHIIQQVDSGRLPNGHKLPSVRQFAQQQDVSINTSLSCYRFLEQKGIIEAHARSGFYITQRQVLSETAFPRFASKVVTLPPVWKYQGRSPFQSHPFYSAQLSPELSPSKLISQALSRICRQSIDGLLAYSPPQGSASLRQTLADYFTEQNFPLSADELMIHHGCIDGIRLALEVTTQPGDVVAVNSPCFSGLLTLLATMGRQVLEIPSDRKGMDMDQLLNNMQHRRIQACLLTATHQNPTGLNLSSQQKQQIAQAANRFAIPVIEDDVYLDLYFHGVMPLPIKHWDQQGHVIWVSSVSKTLAAGLKLGWCAAGRYQQAMLEFKKGQNQVVSPILEKTLQSLILSGHYSRHLRQVRRRLNVLKTQYRQLLLEHLPIASSIVLPKGGQVLWVNVPGLDTRILNQQLSDQNIYCRMGGEFSSREFYRDCFRINISWSIDSKIRQQLSTICETCHKIVNTHTSLK